MYTDSSNAQQEGTFFGPSISTTCCRTQHPCSHPCVPHAVGCCPMQRQLASVNMLPSGSHIECLQHIATHTHTHTINNPVEERKEATFLTHTCCCNALSDCQRPQSHILQCIIQRATVAPMHDGRSLPHQGCLLRLLLLLLPWRLSLRLLLIVFTNKV